MKTADLKVNFKREQLKFQKSRKAELDYARQLRSVAKQVDSIIQGFTLNGEVTNQMELQSALKRYSELIGPWAKSVASRMLFDISRRDEMMWKQMGDQIGRELKKEVEFAPTGRIMAEALNEQIALIKSLPLEAGRRVHDLTMLGLSDSSRASEIAKEIMRSGQVTKSRANLIARTEVARTATELTKARAVAAGITHYVWRTSGDADVRQSHKHMNGKVIVFNQPPEVEPGKRYHAGQFPNCRCYCEPIVPEEE